jgi:hypothetical protein
MLNSGSWWTFFFCGKHCMPSSWWAAHFQISQISEIPTRFGHHTIATGGIYGEREKKPRRHLPNDLFLWCPLPLPQEIFDLINFCSLSCILYALETLNTHLSRRKVDFVLAFLLPLLYIHVKVWFSAVFFFLKLVRTTVAIKLINLWAWYQVLLYVFMSRLTHLQVLLRHARI